MLSAVRRYLVRAVRYFILNIQPYRRPRGARRFAGSHESSIPALSLSNVLPLSGGDCPKEYKTPVFVR